MTPRPQKDIERIVKRSEEEKMTVGKTNSQLRGTKMILSDPPRPRLSHVVHGSFHTWCHCTEEHPALVCTNYTLQVNANAEFKRE